MRNYKLYPVKTPAGIINNNDPLFKAVFDESPDAIFLLNADNFLIIDCNSKAVQIFQANEKLDLFGKESFSLYNSEPVEFSKNQFIETINKGMEHTQELAFRSLKGNVFWGRVSIRRVNTAKGSLIIFRVRRVVDYMKTTEMLSSIIKHTSKATGFEFFKVLTELLCENFSVSMAYVAHIDYKYNSATTLNCWYKNQFLQNITFDLASCPAVNVLKGYSTYYPGNLNEMFPDDKLVAQYGLKSFLGTPIFDASGDVCGLLVLMDDKQMEEIPNSRNILSLFASRAGAELSRIEVEENYKKQIQELFGEIGSQ